MTAAPRAECGMFREEMKRPPERPERKESPKASRTEQVTPPCLRARGFAELERPVAGTSSQLSTALLLLRRTWLR